MAVPTVEQMVSRWTSQMGSGATRQKYLDGINAVTESPMAKAADADQLYLARVQESVTSGRRAQRLRSIPLSKYKDGATKKVDRLASGAQSGQDNYRQAAIKWAPIYQQVHDACKAMPKGSRSDAKARAAKAIDMLMDAAGRTA